MKNLSEENRVCAAQLPAQTRGTPRIRPDPEPLPCGGHPHVPWGGGGVGEALTSQAVSANRSCPFRTPGGFPGPSRGRDPAPTTPNLSLKEGPDLTGGNQGWDAPGRGRNPVDPPESPSPAARLLRGPERGRHGRSHTVGRLDGER